MILERFKVTDKIAIVTGCTRGIGLAIAHALGEAGAKLVVTSRTDKFGGLESLKKANFDVSFFEGDMHDRSVPQKIIDYAIKEKSRLDILVNNAGVAQHGDIETYNDNLLNKIMNTNVDAVFRMCRSAITPMKKQNDGVILNIGSISGLVSNIPQPQVAYNASKAGLLNLTKSLAVDLAKYKIRVNSISPGYTITSLNKKSWNNKSLRSIRTKKTSLKRWASPDEYNEAVLFLLDNKKSSYMTGANITIDGGWTSKGL